MRRRRLTFALLSMLSVLPTANATAQQLAFRQRLSGAAVEFDYRYRDLDRHERALGFALPATQVEGAMQAFRDYSLAGLNRHIEQAIETLASREGIATRFTMTASGRRSAHFDGPADRIARLEPRLPEVLAQARTEYLGRHLRLNEGNAVYVDYRAAVAAGLRVMGPLAAALRDVARDDGETGYARAALAFLQSIPYDDFIDVSRYGGVDFAPVAAMLKLNAGDCDSKAVAMAVLMRLLVPKRSIIVVRTRPATTVAAHALAMADIAARPGDAVLRHAGRSFVALEASGPALAEPGVVDARIRDHLGRGDVVVAEVGR